MKAGRAGSFIIRSVGVIVVEVKVRDDVAGSLGSEEKEW